MKLTILGCYAATPTTRFNPSAQLLEIKNHLFLIDCGEGTQVQLRKHKIKFTRINHIFISHLHGDHFFGLPGLISSFRLLGRERALHIYGPVGLKEAITLLLKLGDSWTNYPLIFHELSSDNSEKIYEDDKVKVTTLPLDHRVYTNGFLFKEKEGDRKLDVEAARKYKIDKSQFQNIKKGAGVTLDDGTYLPNEQVSLPPPKPKTYAYCSDTMYQPALAGRVTGVDVLYHEATFLHTEAHLAKKTKHTTAKQAAQLAQKANVGCLILGHYSTRYKSLRLFKEEATRVFPYVELAEDGKVFNF
ncbi:ribonuclease Z [Muriicola sp. Z0-33]|uniref:ribonuclease Z n=1 Tax=Muriicola sp. Z0-33 TaxID=2816957 RepID=UPI00223872F6|nr:ribonuclease Z [Muriicola sp. Z0-33]MCW5517460.1 ribonuclease Z [Muriicola sp. Z0-33]